MRLLDGVSAVDDEDLASDIGGGLGRQEYRHRGGFGGGPGAPDGVLRAATISSPSDDAVSIHPGATELAVTPWRPYSSAIERMTPSIAPFDLPYPPGAARSPSAR